MEYKFSDLLNIRELHSFFDSFFNATNINCKILDINGDVLLDCGSRDICSKFHQNNLSTYKKCKEAKMKIINDLKDGNEYSCVKCANGLTSVGVPIKIQGKHFAILYFGQYHLETPDYNFFIDQSEKHSFPREDYIKCVELAPVISEEKLNSIIELMLRLCSVIGKVGYDTLQELHWNIRLDANYQQLEATYEELVATEEELRAQFDELQQSKQRLKRSEERYKLALLGSHDGIWDWDIINNSYYYSEKWANMLGYTKSDLPLKGSWRELIHPSDLAIFDNEINTYIKSESERYKCEYRLRKKDGNYIWVSDVGAATWSEDGIPVRMVGSHTDITEQKNLSEKIQRMAYYDSLTELPNKFTLYQDLKTLCKGEERFSVIFMDLDNFKSVNDMLSHSSGDSLLKNLSFDLSALVGDSCSIYRWGGDEFIFILKNVEDDIQLSAFLDNLVKFTNKSYNVDGNEIYVSASIGACMFPRDSRIPEDLIKHSDTAMYHSKSLGKNTYQIYSPDFSQKVLEQISLARDLRKALKNNEFRVYYQPRMDVKTNSLVGMEALLRWIKTDGTIISPLKFIPAAEETGLIIPIGEFVIKASCKQLKQWKDKGYSNLTVSINLSPKQIDDKNLLNVIKTSVEENEINPSNIELEITESAAIKDMNQTIALLKELKLMGINVLLDDFGTGYSSLNFLRLLPVTTIKIDKSFMDKVEEDSPEKTIVRSLISLAHDIRMKVIAEGIETPSQLSFLKDNLCDEAQGFYFSRPIPPLEFEELLANTFKA